MERRQYLKATGIVSTGGLTGLAGCSGSGTGDGGGDSTSEPQQTTDGSSGTTGNSNTVLMITEGSQYYFDPIGLFVESGDTVTFEIQSGNHSATAYQNGNGPASVTRIPEGAQAFDSGTLSEQGATFEHTFETTGDVRLLLYPAQVARHGRSNRRRRTRRPGRRQHAAGWEGPAKPNNRRRGASPL